eukprot:3689925-Rhodomonas_salina.1
MAHATSRHGKAQTQPSRASSHVSRHSQPRREAIGHLISPVRVGPQKHWHRITGTHAQWNALNCLWLRPGWGSERASQSRVDRGVRWPQAAECSGNLGSTRKRATGSRQAGTLVESRQCTSIPSPHSSALAGHL